MGVTGCRVSSRWSGSSAGVRGRGRKGGVAGLSGRCGQGAEPRVACRDHASPEVERREAIGFGSITTTVSPSTPHCLRQSAALYAINQRARPVHLVLRPRTGARRTPRTSQYRTALTAGTLSPANRAACGARAAADTRAWLGESAATCPTPATAGKRYGTGEPMGAGSACRTPTRNRTGGPRSRKLHSAPLVSGRTESARAASAFKNVPR